MADTEHLSPLERCPDDVLYHIQDQIRSIASDRWREGHPMHKSSMCSLRLTSRRLNTLFTRFVINDLGPRLVIKDGELLLRLPFPIPEIFLPFISSLHFLISLDFYNFANPEKVAGLLSPIWAQVSRCKSLRAVSVNWYSHNEKWESKLVRLESGTTEYECVAEDLLRAIYQATDGQLASLEWTTLQPILCKHVIPQSLPPFSALQTLRINTGSDGPEHLVESLPGKMITDSPDLRVISLSSSMDPFCKLEELFPSRHGTSAIESLYVVGALPNMGRMPSFKLPSIRNLQNLELYPGFALHSPASYIDPLWVALKSCSAQLAKIDIGYGISDALMEYLSSYEGLTRCCLSFGSQRARIAPSSDAFARAVLPRHAPSLTLLSVTALYPDTGYESTALSPRTGPHHTHSFVSNAS
ncbi:hypothetical protein AX16_005772 [Volvariella volvacea WC 439]|nr:hypothetical protein AX16_005772 [Volvariella volvacea WC 439]